MNKKLSLLTALVTLCILLSSCEAIGTIFKAGVWTGIFLLAIMLVLIVFIARWVSGKK
jgi:hypothetical protein